MLEACIEKEELHRAAVQLPAPFLVNGSPQASLNILVLCKWRCVLHRGNHTAVLQRLTSCLTDIAHALHMMSISAEQMLISASLECG